MSLLNKVTAWLQANPSKCINADLISDYFDVHRSKVASELAFAVREGELGLDAQGGEDAEPVWYLPKSDWAVTHGKQSKAAVEKPQLKSVSEALPILQTAPWVKPRFTKQNFSELPIEDDVPTQPIARRGAAQYLQLLDLFKKMKPGQSVLVPACAALSNAANIFNKQAGQRVERRKADEDQMRVWRTE